MSSVLLLTTVHPRTDTRIFIKEAQTLASSLSHKVFLMVADGKGHIDEEQGRVSIHDLGDLGHGRLRRMLRGPWRAFFAIMKIKPVIVHFHDPELIPLGILLKMMGYKVIYDVHEDVPRQILSKYYLHWILRKPIAWVISVVEWIGASSYNAIVSATPKISERFSAVKVVTVQNFPLASELIPSIPILYSERPKSFVYVGVISSIRGATEMILAFEHLKDIHDAKLELAGEFIPSNLEHELRKLPEWNSVNYHGLVSRECVAKIMGGGRAGLATLHPTINYIDSYPIKMFEYMSASLPVIASDFPLWRQIIEGAGCGLLVDPMVPSSIADAMRWILEHPQEAEAMGQRGRQAVMREYNWDAEGVKLIELYRKVLKIIDIG
jgi:glycosyltransferase involved in cell wall biosynthesis